MLRETITLEGPLLRGDLMSRVLARVVDGRGTFELIDLKPLATADGNATARITIGAAEPDALDRLLEALRAFGAKFELADARTAPAEADGILPDEFHASTSFDTFVRAAGRWQAVRALKMDCALVLRDGAPICVKQRLVKKGELVVLRGPGIRAAPPDSERTSTTFSFMSHDVSSETNKSVVIARIAQQMKETRAAREKIVVVAGPAIVHTGGDVALARLVRAGYVDLLLAGNAFAAHDLEKAIVGTSLGVCQKSGKAVEGGSRNHLFAINAVNRAGGIKNAVASGLVKSGVMFELVKKGAKYVLAGSIRDDGPLADVIPDVREAQLAYAKELEGAGLCLMLATALHSIAVGNLLPARVKTVCVDMSEALPTKLANRGTLHAIGLVTDVGSFLERLASELGV